MYQITKKALSPDAQVENCVRVILDDFNRSPEKFNETTLSPAINVTASVTTDNVTTNVTTTVRDPWKPCHDQVGLIQVNASYISDADRDAIVANIRDRFKCLYYSYRNRVLGEDPTAMTELEAHDNENFCGSTCLAAEDNCGENSFGSLFYRCCYSWQNDFLDVPLFLTNKEDRPQGGRGPSVIYDSASFFFDYKYPAKLPSRIERFKKGWVFNYDVFLALDSTAEDLVIAVFDEFSGCAVSTKFFYLCEWANE